MNDSFTHTNKFRYKSSQKFTADTVVLIRRPLIKRIYSHILRVLKGKDRHPETGMWQDILFTKAIVRRWWQGEQAALDESLVPYQEKMVVLKNFKEAERYVASLHNTLYLLSDADQ